MNKKYNKIIYGTGAILLVLLIGFTMVYFMLGSRSSKLDRVKAEENIPKDITLNAGINKLRKTNKACDIYMADELIAEKIAIASERKNNGDKQQTSVFDGYVNQKDTNQKDANQKDANQKDTNQKDINHKEAEQANEKRENEYSKANTNNNQTDLGQSNEDQSNANTTNSENVKESDGGEHSSEQSPEQNLEQISPQWIFYGSAVKPPYDGEMKAQIDAQVASWVNGSLSDSGLQQWFMDYIYDEKGLSMQSMGFIGNYKILLHLEKNIDYSKCFDEMNAHYSFIGIYTKGERDEYGNLIGYRWDLSVD